MSFIYEQPYTYRRGGPDDYRQWADEQPTHVGSGRRALHWRHLDSHFRIADGSDMHDEAPHRQMELRRRQEAAAAAQRALERARLDDPVGTTRRKRFVPPRAQAASIAPYGIVVEHEAPRMSKRMLIGPEDDLNPDYSPRRAHTPPASVRRSVPCPGAAVTRDTSRVLDLNIRRPEEEAVRPRGMRKITPEDALQDNYVGKRDAKVDRGLRCHYDIQHNLSFHI